ncbi:hypothetical protein DXG03_004871 [Asterophora parasitica]|uniref:F-box domain-containing protein n=1 Tax=Asterophora parasitica TaxID=117018 RepID=A0A9P7KG69_9AGAR|nr:hypothetical protein DXG03_004871 [Asterophora parasitica]
MTEYHLTPADAALLEKVKSYSGSPNDDFLSGSERLRAAAILSHAESALSNSLNFESRATSLTRHPLPKEILDLIRILRVALAPHKRLPPELLTEIFVFASSYQVDWLHNNYTLGLQPDTTKLPWVLGQVCALWRRISRCERRFLWRNLYIALCPNHERVVLWLCSVLPRHVRLSIDFSVYGFSRLCSMTTKMVVCKRVQSVTLDLSPEGYDELWKAILVHRGSFSLLEHAKFSVVDDDDEEGTTPTTSVAPWADVHPFVAAASLKSLQLGAKAAHCSALLAVRFPWPQLTMLDIGNMEGLGIDDILSMLEKCTSLQQLMATLSFGSHDTANRLESRFGRLVNLPIVDLRLALGYVDPIRLYSVLKLCPHLENLKLTAVVPVLAPGDDNEHNCLKPIIFPNLQILYLNSISHPWLFRILNAPILHQLDVVQCLINISPITQMLQRSSCPLAILSIYGSKDTSFSELRTLSASLPSLLKAAPNLMRCTLAAMVVSDALLRDIAFGHVLPHLVELFVTPETLTGFVEMIQTRVRREIQEEGGLRIRRAWADIRDNFTDEEVSAADQAFRLLRKDYGVFCSLV